MFLKNVLFTERKEICIFIVQHCIYIKSLTCYDLGVHNTTVNDEEQLTVEILLVLFVRIQRNYTFTKHLLFKVFLKKKKKTDNVFSSYIFKCIKQRVSRKTPVSHICFFLTQEINKWMIVNV